MNFQGYEKISTIAHTIYNIANEIWKKGITDRSKTT